MEHGDIFTTLIAEAKIISDNLSTLRVKTFVKIFHSAPAFLEKGLIPAEGGWLGNVLGGAVEGGGGGQKPVVRGA